MTCEACHLPLPANAHALTQFCPPCKRKRELHHQRLRRNKSLLEGNSGPLPMEPLDPKDPLVLLILAGYGDVPQEDVPADVLRDAEAGRMPRPNPDARGNDALREGLVRLRGAA